MATFKQGNMFSVFSDIDYFIITTNSTIKMNGAVVMGRGIAKQVRDAFPGIDVEIGNAIMREIDVPANDAFYGLILGSKVGVFQVKHHWRDKAEISLIMKSANMLYQEAMTHPEKAYALNFPGIGNGGLKYDDVLPIISALPDNVQIWTFN